VWCRPPGLEDLLPLTKAISDNPENAKVTISGPVSRVTEVNEEGRYIFEDLPAGSYQVTASAKWYLSQTQTVELLSGQGVELDPFLLGRGTGTIKGRIVCGGKGIAKATLQATNVTTAHIPSATYSEADGSYSMEVPAGQYLVFAGGIFDPECSALAEAYNDTTHSFVVEPGATVTHDIILELPQFQVWELIFEFPGPAAYVHSLQVYPDGAFTGTRQNPQDLPYCNVGPYMLAGKFSGDQVSFTGALRQSCLVNGVETDLTIVDSADGQANAPFPNATTASGTGTAETWALSGETQSGWTSADPITLSFSWTARRIDTPSTTPAPSPTPTPVPPAPIETTQPPTPSQLSPLSGSVFDFYPRDLELRWGAVSWTRPVTYVVEIDCFHCCGYGEWCTDLGETWQLEETTATSLWLSWVGAQPGRWRVWCKDDQGKESLKSGWWDFEFTT